MSLLECRRGAGQFKDRQHVQGRLQSVSVVATGDQEKPKQQLAKPCGGTTVTVSTASQKDNFQELLLSSRQAPTDSP